MTSPDGIVTYRPLGSRVAAAVGSVCLVAVLAVMWFAFPQSVRDAFKLVEILTLLLFLAASLAILYGIARTSVTYDDSRIRIRNGFRHHEVDWSDVDSLWMDRGMPWATLTTTGGQRVLVMAVQASDGDRATAQLRKMRARAIEAGGLAGGQGRGAVR
ncbi:MAG: hypothetical protein AVDCRST_MAG29-609 [uncultured Nocardioidaceae bacterium]|uniref:Low molecular weight protein antigen 6 PH domain-containing protein n=1 Tax=uncultured Nocardioidaceae bacterium TaxID=253824 RepID=A0A6J4L6T9_9ACTN|nr:MAG: hypothetical protein AVDCRST_MAG29-609 [uncultured Nocardioidaceae bacterium]